MAKEAAFLEVLEGTAAIPWTLTLRHEHDTFRIGRRSARTAQSAADGNHAAIRRDLDGPATEEVVRFIGSTETETHPDIAIAVRKRTEGEFVTFRVAPVARERIVPVRHAIAIGIADPRDLAPGRRQHRTIAPCDREDLILSTRKEMVFRLRGRCEGTLHEIDVAPPCTHCHAAVRKHRKAPRLHRNSRRNGDIDNRIVLRLGGRRAPHGPEIFFPVQRPQQANSSQRYCQVFLYHWYSTVIWLGPGASVSGIRTSSVPPVRSKAVCGGAIRTRSGPTTKLRSPSARADSPAATRK